MGGILHKLVENGQRDHRRLHDQRQHRGVRPRRAAPSRLPAAAGGRAASRRPRRSASWAGGSTSSWRRSSRATSTSPRCRTPSASSGRRRPWPASGRWASTTGAARFLNLPFYQTGKVRKDPVGPADVAIVRSAARGDPPDLVFVAGDLSDPHGTHRMCKEAIERALAEYAAAGGRRPEVWLYRGAWQEWPVTEADLAGAALPGGAAAQDPGDLQAPVARRTRRPFPGPDEREFWQRVEARNKGTAAELDRLGLAEYFAMEAFVVE